VSKLYRFGEFRLDCGSYELLRAGHAVKLERKPMELLVLFVSRQGEMVTRAEIVERLWSSEIYVDTEHGINTAIRKLRLTLRDDPAEPRFIKTVTGVGYCFIAPVIAESAPGIGEVEAPALTDDSAVSGAPVTAELAARRSRSHGAFWVIAAVALVVVATLLLIRMRHRNVTPVITTLAVLPLDNFSGDPGQEYLADGMTDELITMIARNSTLRITSRTSVMQYKGAHRPLSEIARSLGVDGIVEGSIARKGDQVHMTLQLIRADTDSHIWAQSFDRDTSDTSLAEEAAQEIAKQLHSATPVATTQRYINPAAHDAYLRGKYLWISDKMGESGAYFRQATEIQPDYAAAWAGLADYYGEGVAGDVLDPRTSLGPQETAAKRAVALGPDLAEAHQAMTGVYLIGRWDWANADLESQRAIALDPHDGELYYLRSCVLEAMNRDAESLEAAKKAVELIPLERPTAIGDLYSFTRQFDAALAELNLRLEAFPNNGALLFSLSDVWRRKGNYKEAVDAWAKWRIASGDAQAAADARKAYKEGGARGFIRWQLRRREVAAKSYYVSPVELAGYHAQLGERNPTLALLEEGYRQHATNMLWVQDDPAYDFLNADPRFRAIITGVGRPTAH